MSCPRSRQFWSTVQSIIALGRNYTKSTHSINCHLSPNSLGANEWANERSGALTQSEQWRAREWETGASEHNSFPTQCGCPFCFARKKGLKIDNYTIQLQSSYNDKRERFFLREWMWFMAEFWKMSIQHRYQWWKLYGRCVPRPEHNSWRDGATKTDLLPGRAKVYHYMFTF